MNNLTIEVLNEADIREYSELINKVMEEFNKEEINGFQLWFASVEGIIYRRESGFDNGNLDTIQFAAKCDGIIVGALEVEDKNHIQSFFVKKEFQNKGIGRMLLRHSMDFFEKNGFAVIGYSVLASDYAIDIYKSFGFEGEGKWLYLDMKEDNENYIAPVTLVCEKTYTESI